MKKPEITKFYKKKLHLLLFPPQSIFYDEEPVGFDG